MFSKIQSLLWFSVFNLNWPEFTSGELRTLEVFVAFVALFIWEARFGRRGGSPKTARQSYLTNTGLFILNDTMMSLLSISSLCIIAERFSSWGLLGPLEDLGWKTMLSFILLDLSLYLWHRACHTFDWLWMFHKVHHSDPCMNVSTSFRLHFMEVFLTTLVKAVFIVVTGVDRSVVLANELLITLFIMFHHANISFRGEHWLGRLTIVPYLHRVHHSALREEHDRNYGAVFSIWDRMFGTLVESEPAALGLAHVRQQRLLELLKFGLTRVYSPAPAEADSPCPQRLKVMIAEAAYYRAEKRGFAPGFDFLDWLEAEKEIYGS